MSKGDWYFFAYYFVNNAQLLAERQVSTSPFVPERALLMACSVCSIPQKSACGTSSSASLSSTQQGEAPSCHLRSVTCVSGCVESLVILGPWVDVVAGLRAVCTAPADCLPRSETAPKDLLAWTYLFTLPHSKFSSSVHSLTPLYVESLLLLLLFHHCPFSLSVV